MRILVFAALAVATAMPAAAQPVPSAPPIFQMQRQLKAQGYDPGPVDGVMTDKTRRALRESQRRGMAPPGAGVAGQPIVEVQQYLQRLGFFAAPVDGTLGPRTRDAIIRFQAAKHLPVDPRVSDRLLADLQQALAVAADGPPAIAAALPSTVPPAPNAEPEATGRQPLPPGVTPPAIR